MKPHALTTYDIQCRRVYAATGIEIPNTPLKRSRWENCLAQSWGGRETEEWQPGQGTCKGCGRSCDTSPTIGHLGAITIELASTVCSDCMELVREHYDPARTAVEAVTDCPKWDDKCPSRHKAVVLGEVRPEKINWAAYERALQWDPKSGRGLIMVGSPGTGKSSAFWAMARQIEMEGTTPIPLGSLELGRILGNAAKDITEVGWLYRTRILMVDDLGKERASPGVASLLWEVLDRRLAANLPCIITTNYTGDAFAARFGDQELGDAIRRRLSDLCRVLQF